MRPWITNICSQSRDDYRISFESTGALEFDNEYSGLAVAPAHRYCFRRIQARIPCYKSNILELAMKDSQYTAFVGIDWADAKHDYCIQSSTAKSTDKTFGVVAHVPAELEEWLLALHQQYGGRLAFALELSSGPIVSVLQKYDFIDIYPITPSTLAKYREAFKPSRAKDDPSDAELALDLITRHPERFKKLQPQSVEMRTLVSLVEHRRKLVHERVRVTNRLRTTLKQYYPQILEWFDHIDTPMFCEFLENWPTLKKAQRVRKTTLTTFFSKHNMDRANVLERRFNAIDAATALTNDPAIIDPHQLLALAHADMLRTLLRSIAKYDKQIASIAPQLDDYQLFESLPGAGPMLTPRLLAAVGEQRDRFKTAAELQQYAGIAPVTERSGKKHWVHWRWQCPTFLRQTFIEWAGQTIKYSTWARVYYDQQRNKGATHQAAIRSLAFKWIRILYSCWKTSTPYDESRYINTLKKRVSPLMSQIELAKTA